jgi:hypothetical protein
VNVLSDIILKVANKHDEMIMKKTY